MQKPHSKKSSNQETGFVYKMRLQGVIRLLAAIALFFAELFIFIFLAMRLADSGFIILTSLQVAGFAFVLYLINKRRDSSYTTAWTIAVLSFPALGLLLYFFWGRRKRFPQKEARYQAAIQSLSRFLPDTRKQLSELNLQMQGENIGPAGLQLRYLAGQGFPLYRGCKTTYFKDGESQFRKMLSDLQEARSYIFMEYFILSDGILWQKIEPILLEKAGQGVDVRILYDDFGSTAKLPPDIQTRLTEGGIQICNFNPVLRLVSGMYINYRNHQKILVIDGSVSWVGGANLADEYANLHERFGHWKDSALRMEGEVSQAATVYFLEMWSIDERIIPDLDEEKFFAPVHFKDHKVPETPDIDTDVKGSLLAASETEENSIVHFRDGPLNNPKNPAYELYLSLINTSVRRLYIVTPYFIVDDELMNSICRAAASGVDVRLLTPGIPDKKNVFIVTRSHFGRLLRSGAKVYEYTPGFIHSKMMIADGNRAVIGSINLDYRSLYLNFENAVYLSNDSSVTDMEKDFLETLLISKELTLEEWQTRPVIDKIREPFFRIFSPLL